jgi:sialate O-acetylesterase
MPKPELDACAAGPDLEKRYQERFEHFPADVKKKFETETAEWTKQNPTPQLQAERLATRPMLAPGEGNIPARLYNGMIHGFEPYTLKGVIWFQGDGNCGHPQDYGVLFKTLITAWRAHFHDERLPFYYVEMQNYAKAQEKPVEPNALSEIREQQQAALELPGVDVATGVDQGIRIPNYEAHFPDKKPLGKRLAGLALDHLYGQPGLVHSPQLKSFKVDGNKVRLTFDYADGLRLRGNELAGFAIRAKNGEWVWAKGQIDGQDIIVYSDQISDPADVRYAWAYNPTLSVENSAGLPLRPFRTDTASKN